MKVQSAIQARIHASLKQEYKILAEIIRDYTDPAYPYETEGGQEIKAEDFDDRIDVVPVSDPNASTMAQRIMQYQAALQLAQQSPDLYDLPLLHRQMMALIGIPNADEVVPDRDEVPPKDPVRENQDILTMAPVKSYEYQDHEAHMRVHMVMKSDPELSQQVQNSPAGGAVMGALDAHIREHLAFVFRRQIEVELGMPLPSMDEPLPDGVERRLSSLIADAADQMMGKKQQQAQAQKNAEMQQDPIIQQREREIAIREMAAQGKQQTDTAKQDLEQQKLAASIQRDQSELAASVQQDQSEVMLERQKLSLQEQKMLLDAEQFEEAQEVDGYKTQMEEDRMDAKEESEGFKTALDIEQRKLDRRSKGE